MRFFGKRLSATIFGTVLLYSVAIALVFAALFSAFFYFVHENQAEQDLKQSVTVAAAMLSGESPEDEIDILESQLANGLRYTLIAPDGTVIFNSGGSLEENHADRPEFQNALVQGSSSVMRYSETLGQDTIYAAHLLDSGDVLRVSEVRESYFAVLGSIAIPLAAALVLIVLLSVILSRWLTRGIVSPLDNVDVSNPLANKTYAEMLPLLTRIDEQKKQLVEQNLELKRAEDLRREFSANVSHEMKTPLQVISGYAEILEAGELPEEDVRKFAGIIMQESRNMTALIDDVLILSRIDDPVMENAGRETVELLQVCKEAAVRFIPLAERHEVKICVFGSTVEISANKGLLLQLVGNLISNAIRYSGACSEVRISVGKTLIDEKLDDLPEAFIRVKDSGCGIPTDEQEKIFERFYRVDKSRSKETGGTGLGLAIAKHAAEFHGASITVESEPGKGSTFTVHFPLSDRVSEILSAQRDQPDSLRTIGQAS